MHPLSRNAVLALIGVTLVLHTTEEYLTFPAFLWSSSRLQRCVPPPRGRRWGSDGLWGWARDASKKLLFDLIRRERALVTSPLCHGLCGF